MQCDAWDLIVRPQNSIHMRFNFLASTDGEEFNHFLKEEDEEEKESSEGNGMK